MINILSIRCSLAFAPYLAESAAEFLTGGAITSQVVRQGGNGLILRSDGDFVLRHQHRQSSLGREDVRHYRATINFRAEFHDVYRMRDEIVMVNIGNEVLLSHPQSELWLGSEMITALRTAFNSDSATELEDSCGVPEWLKVSTGGGRLLISDQRNGRWVLLGDDHLNELDRRLASLSLQSPAITRHVAPTISLKGLTVHLQSALKLAETLEAFANTGNVTPFEEITSIYLLAASRCTEGLELRDSDKRVAFTSREARKWAAIISSELERVNARQVERGRIRTVFVDSEDGRWILQWGDQVFIPNDALSKLLPSASSTVSCATDYPSFKRTGNFLLLLSPDTSACVALNDAESNYLHGEGWRVSSGRPAKQRSNDHQMCCEMVGRGVAR